MISIFNDELIEDIINSEPLEIKSVLISRKTWTNIRPYIKQLQKYGFWYDVSECADKIMLRAKVNDITQAHIEKLLQKETV